MLPHLILKSTNNILRKTACCRYVKLISDIKTFNHCYYKKLSSDSKNALSKQWKRKTLKEMAMAPSDGKAFELGKGIVAGSSLVGLGALCYYGMGLSQETGTFDQMMFWPDYVRQRVRDTYAYFGGSIGITALTAFTVFNTPILLNIVSKNSIMAIAATTVAMIGSGILVQSLPYERGFGMKQLAWILHSSILGSVIAPVCLLGGPLVLRAAWYTAGITGGLSAVAICAPNDKFLSMAGPLSIGLGIVFASSIGSMFLPPTSALGAGLYSISLYGGLVLFSFYLLYDTQKIIHRAQNYPPGSSPPYDPINNSLSIYIDTINIFMRVVAMLSGGGSPSKKR